MMDTRVRYLIDGRASRFTVQAFAGGFAAVMAHNPKFAIRDFTGETQFVPGTLEDASLRVTVKASSLDLLDEVGAKDRREIQRVAFEEVLNTDRFPEIVFGSSQITSNHLGENMYRVSVSGNLTLHGVTRGHAFAANVTVGGDTLRGNGEFTLKQTDYNIKLVSVAGGMVKVKDELKFSFDVVALKQG
jgi:polyisoprenoid-binding protein YceI